MSQITHHVAISGMTCGGCSGRVTNVLANTPGVIQAEISHESNSGVIVSTDEISIQEIKENVCDVSHRVSSIEDTITIMKTHWWKIATVVICGVFGVDMGADMLN